MMSLFLLKQFVVQVRFLKIGYQMPDLICQMVKGKNVYVSIL